jgi:hypothetical protein
MLQSEPGVGQTRSFGRAQASCAGLSLAWRSLRKSTLGYVEDGIPKHIHKSSPLPEPWMRKPFALFLAAVLLVAAAAWWTFGDIAVSVVPGWHTPILAPYATAAVFIIAVLLAIAFVAVFKQLGGRKKSR